MRALTKSGIAAGLNWSGVGKLVGACRGLHGEPLVVGYHRVVNDFARCHGSSISPMLTSSRTLERHLDWIGRRYRFVSLDELARDPGQKKRSGKPVAAITFDDGYSDVFYNAFPVLMRKGIPFAVFVVTSLVGTRRLQAHDEIYLLLSNVFERPKPAREHLWRDAVEELGSGAEAQRRAEHMLNGFHNPFQATRAVLENLAHPEINDLVGVLRSRIEVPERALEGLQSLSWNMLSEMIARGVTIGSHTKTHVLLSGQRIELVRDEVEGSRRELEERLGTPIRHFAYPDGSFDSRSVQAVAEAGYRAAYTTCRHRDTRHPQLTIPRKMLWENSCMNSSGRFSPAIFSCQVNGIFDAADKCRQPHGVEPSR